MRIISVVHIDRVREQKYRDNRVRSRSNRSVAFFDCKTVTSEAEVCDTEPGMSSVVCFISAKSCIQRGLVLVDRVMESSQPKKDIAKTYGRLCRFRVNLLRLFIKLFGFFEIWVCPDGVNVPQSYVGLRELAVAKSFSFPGMLGPFFNFNSIVISVNRLCEDRRISRVA